MSQEYNKYDTDYFIKYDLVDPSLGAIDAGMTNGNITGNYNEWAMRSDFGRTIRAWAPLGIFPLDIRRMACNSGEFHGGYILLAQSAETARIIRFPRE